jgi:rubredoxin
MVSCSYNGWVDVPEDEREAQDIFEATLSLPADRLCPRAEIPPTILHRKAA